MIEYLIQFDKLTDTFMVNHPVIMIIIIGVAIAATLAILSEEMHKEKIRLKYVYRK